MNALPALRAVPEGPPPRVVPIPVALALEAERLAATGRTRGSMVASVVLHVLVALFMILGPKPKTAAQEFTEITLLEPGPPEPEPAIASRATPAPQTASGAYATSTREARFARGEARAQVTPVPQSETAFEDRLQARLATLQQGAASPMPGVAEAPLVGVLAQSPARPASLGAGAGRPVDLKRGGGSDAGPPIALTRGPGLGDRAPAPATLAAAGPAPAPAAADAGSTLRRSLAGAQLMGPVADRPILFRRTPEYPEWAMRGGIEGSVSLHFIVRADGTVKENILVDKTAGFEDFDESARQALRVWRFQPLTGGRTGEQWGNITFHFRIREAG